MQRQATQEQLDSTQTPEFQANLRELVAEPGQRSLAHKFLSSSNFGNVRDPLTPMELRILKSCNKPLPSDWEDKHSIWEDGDEVSSAYGNLTLRGLIVWELRTGKGTWLVPKITDQGKAVATG